jgi:Acetylornithine deacetylase/Succinyl-diaminopimelate desuccinylase and related deacylases
VPPCAGWNSDPFKAHIEDGKLTGLGANDAKGSVAAMIMTAREIQHADFDGSITFAFVADEERSGEGIRTIKPKLGHIDAALVGEPTGLRFARPAGPPDSTLHRATAKHHTRPMPIWARTHTQGGSAIFRAGRNGI